MAQFMTKQNHAHADAAMCAPAACSARMSSASSVDFLSDTAMCAVSVFVSIVLVLAVALRLSVRISLLVLIIMNLLVWCRQGNAKSVFAWIPETV